MDLRGDDANRTPGACAPQCQRHPFLGFAKKMERVSRFLRRPDPFKLSKVRKAIASVTPVIGFVPAVIPFAARALPLVAKVIPGTAPAIPFARPSIRSNTRVSERGGAESNDLNLLGLSSTFLWVR